MSELCMANVEITYGPRPRIVCAKCKRPIRMRGTATGVLFLECNPCPKTEVAWLTSN